MTRHLIRTLGIGALASLAAIVASCQTGTVVLLPSADAKDAALVVKQRDGQTVLAEPYAATRLTTAGPRAYNTNAQEVQALFGPALAAQPSRPVRFTVQFVESKDELTEDSKAALEAIFAEIARRPVPDVLVVGHTDSVGSDQYNDALSRQRADVIRAGLVQNGIAPENITAVGRGKRELLVPTADGVAEPRNRRVEIVVR
jgi:outer membrane protein OmpA-like peptidoglycan-associated protein